MSFRAPKAHPGQDGILRPIVETLGARAVRGIALHTAQPQTHPLTIVLDTPMP